MSDGRYYSRECIHCIHLYQGCKGNIKKTYNCINFEKKKIQKDSKGDKQNGE